MKLASHNSGTGEKPYNIWAKLFGIFCKCQDKTIAEQYQTGVRLFDLRVREIDGVWRLCHGIAQYSKTLDEVFTEFLALHYKTNEDLIVMLTYEGKVSPSKEYWFIEEMTSMVSKYPYILLGSISIKKPKWKTLVMTKNQPTCIQNYPKLIGWKALLPIPILWNIFKKTIDSDECYVMEDFI